MTKENKINPFPVAISSNISSFSYKKCQIETSCKKMEVVSLLIAGGTVLNLDSFKTSFSKVKIHIL